MAGFVPKFRLYDSTGTTLLYTFTLVDFTNAPQSARETVEITSLRSQGGIIIDGGDAMWDMQMRFAMIADDYEALTLLIEDLETTVALNTPYLMRLDKSAGSFFEWKVKRLVPFNYPENLRTNFQRINATFKVNSW